MTQTLQQADNNTLAGTYVDLVFPVFGNTLPIDHGYALYGAVAKRIEWLHGEEAKQERIGLFPVRGTPGGDGTLLIGPGSTLRFRLPAHRLPMFLAMAGKLIMVDSHRLQVGVPTVAALTPAATLISTLVLIKLADAKSKEIGGIVAPDAFLAAVRRQLDALGIAGEPGLLTHDDGPHAGLPRRRVIRVKQQTHVGYSTIISGLTAAESVRLQEQGIGGRRQMGCGLFVPAGETK